jgi:hypothetical protein
MRDWKWVCEAEVRGAVEGGDNGGYEVKGGVDVAGVEWEGHCFFWGREEEREGEEWRERTK